VRNDHGDKRSDGPAAQVALRRAIDWKRSINVNGSPIMLQIIHGVTPINEIKKPAGNILGGLKNGTLDDEGLRFSSERALPAGDMLLRRRFRHIGCKRDQYAHLNSFFICLLVLSILFGMISVNQNPLHRQIPF